MPNHSIFADTMADMTYQEIEEYVQEGAVVLFPIAVIEEHGPHLPLGTDTYLTYSLAKHIQEYLKNEGIKAIIAPSFYWGINVANKEFPGSFSVKPETMKAILKDIIESLENWGFRKVYLLNIHGDFLHCKTILETVQEIYESKSTTAVYDVISNHFKKNMKLNGNEPYILAQKTIMGSWDNDDHSKYIDLHAGGFETSMMLQEFNELVDEKKARDLKSSETTFELLKQWLKGGAEAKEITPMGYLGDPSNISLDKAKKYIAGFTNITGELIKSTLDDHKE